MAETTKLPEAAIVTYPIQAVQSVDSEDLGSDKLLISYPEKTDVKKKKMRNLKDFHDFLES